MHSTLEPLFNNIVQPVIGDLKDLMIENNFCSEVELYASDMHFKMFDYSKDNKYVVTSFGPAKHEDMINNLVYKLNCIRDRYSQIFSEIVNKKIDSLNIADKDQ